MNLTRHQLQDGPVRQMIDTLEGPRRAMWEVDRSAYSPEVFAGHLNGGTVWALVSARPHTAAHKVADLVLTADASRGASPALGQALGEVMDAVAAAHPDHAATRLEIHPWLAADLLALDGVLDERGFIPSRPPLPSIPSTLEPIGAWVRWAQSPRPAAELPPFLGQTTDFTCGAVSLITAVHRAARPMLSAQGDPSSNRRDELRWWRRATNMPACDPIALAVAAKEVLTDVDGPPMVYLTDTGPVLLEGYSGQERERRALLQQLSLAEAESLGIRVQREWPGAEALANLVERGHRVQLLIDETPMHMEEIPHWITAFAVTRTAAGTPAMVVQDPWVDAEHGETWVDSDQLPIALPDLELMARYGDPHYRSAIVLPAN